MNRENLLRMADYIETIPQSMFDMEKYRQGDIKKPECNSIGCVIGHCTILDESNLPRLSNGSIDFYDWSTHFTEVDSFHELEYLFSGGWVKGDNTPTGAAKRIRYFVENGFPDNWKEQIDGIEPLSYL